MKQRYNITEAAEALRTTHQRVKYLQSTIANKHGTRAFTGYVTRSQLLLMCEIEYGNVFMELAHQKAATVAEAAEAKHWREQAFAFAMVMCLVTAIAMCGWWLYLEVVK